MFWNPATSYSPGRFPSRSLPPPAARDGKPSQVQCCTRPQTARKQYSVRFQHKKHPIFMGCFLCWNPATSYSPGRFPSRSLPPGNSHSRALRPLPAIPDAPPRCFAHWARSASVPLAARDGKPNQVQCCTRLKMAREENSRRAKKKPSHKAELFLWNPATSYSPGPSPAKYHRR